MTTAATTTDRNTMEAHEQMARRCSWSLALLGVLAAVIVSASAFVSPALADHRPHGAGFGIAPTVHPDDGSSAPAFPGSRAIWAGTCDLGDPAVAEGISALPPAGPAHCIDHPGGYVIAADDTYPNPDGGVFPPVAAGEGSQCCFSGLEDALPEGWHRGPQWRLAPVAQAGAHPDATASFWFTRGPHVSTHVPPDGDPKEIEVKLPAGFVGNPAALPKCPAELLEYARPKCHPSTQVGVATITLGASNGRTYVVPVYNVEPRKGYAAEFILTAGMADYVVNIPIVGTLRSDGDFGIDTLVTQIPGALPLLGQTVTLWGVPWSSEHDRYRAPESYQGHALEEGTPHSFDAVGMPLEGLSGGVDGQGRSQQPQSYEPSWGPVRPFIANPTECAPDAPVTIANLVSWHRQGEVFSYQVPADVPVDGCAQVPFDASLDLKASRAADSPTGLLATLEVPQNNDPPADRQFNADADDPEGAPAHWASGEGLATAHLDKAVVSLPQGFSVNPAGAAGLAGCSDAQIGMTAQGNPPLFNNGDPFDASAADGAECPAGSVIGTARVQSPLLDAADVLEGELVLGEPKSTAPTSGQMFRMFVVVRNRDRGVIAKIYGSAVAEPSTGRLTATFDENPRLPFDRLALQLKGGARSTLATPPTCGANGWSAAFTPWTAAHGQGGQTDLTSGVLVTDANCASTVPTAFVGGTDDRNGRASGTFSVRFDRADGQRTYGSLAVEMPKGLIASLRGVPLCSNAQAAAGSCPAASRIGTVDAGAGAGMPFFLERKGDIYLTEGYKGGAYGLMVKVPVEAGPFRGQFALSPIVVRQALHVDRTTAQVTAVSDPLPQIHHGIPLRVRQITVKVDRPSFMLNPSDCSPKQIRATVLSAEGARADVANHFQVTGCAALPFKPRIGLRLKGRRQAKTGGHPAVRALVRQQGIGEAGIERAVVRLPKSLALDPDNAQALCEFEDGTKPDLENHCPEGSIVGRARAVTPLLNEPLVGDVYFVKNVRIDEDTGNEIRTLPMIVVALRGEIAINLRGESSTTRSGKLVNTFASVPDAPISRFNLNIKGGRNGILTVTRTRRSEINLCTARRPIAVAKVDGHNGKRADQRIRVRKPCPKGRPAPAKVCRKRTNNRRALRRCVVKVKRNRAQIRRKIARRKAAKRQAARRNAQS